jgi:hypothetical protein
LFFVPGSDSVGECTKEFPIKQEGKKKKETRIIVELIHNWLFEIRENVGDFRKWIFFFFFFFEN